MSKKWISFTMLAALAAGWGGCGGCPWTHLSDLAVTPDSGCVEVAFIDDSGSTEPGGCVDPMLMITNHCEVALEIDNQYLIGGGNLLIGPGDSSPVEVSDTAVTGHHGGDRYDLPATLGDQGIDITFLASGGLAGD